MLFLDLHVNWLNFFFRSNSLSRQSTQDSDTESTISQSGGEPIRKSPREYVIPIALEGGGYVTPRATSLEPSEESRASTHSLPRSRLSSRTKRMRYELLVVWLHDIQLAFDNSFNGFSGSVIYLSAIISNKS